MKVIKTSQFKRVLSFLDWKNFGPDDPKSEDLVYVKAKDLKVGYYIMTSDGASKIVEIKVNNSENKVIDLHVNKKTREVYYKEHDEIPDSPRYMLPIYLITVKTSQGNTITLSAHFDDEFAVIKQSVRA